jgi:RimJ/RimL family protein N-acetyltransferase
MSELGLRAVYLTGPRVYLRALQKEDGEQGAAWLDGTFPVNAGRAEKTLEEDAASSTWPVPKRRLAIARVEGDEVIGGLLITSSDSFRTGWIALTMAPWVMDPDAIRAETLRLVVPWLRDESEMMVVTLAAAADEPETIAAAEELGMGRAARLREWYARPGGRVDCLLYEALNPRWEVRDA